MKRGSEVKMGERLDGVAKGLFLFKSSSSCLKTDINYAQLESCSQVFYCFRQISLFFVLTFTGFNH